MSTIELKDTKIDSFTKSFYTTTSQTSQ